MTILRLAFAGTPEPAADVLAALLERSPHTITAIYTQPDRPAGRGQQLKPGPVKVLAQAHGLPVRQPATAAELEAATDLTTIDALVVVAYGLLLTPTVLTRPRLGCINLHFSLLPRWRGAAPVQRAILAGDHETGISLMQMDAGLDTGPLLAQASEPIQAFDSTGELQRRLAARGADKLIELLPHLADIEPTPQDPGQATYAAKIHKREGQLDWQQPATQLARIVQAFNPAPVANAELGSLNCRIWEARALQQDAGAGRSPGEIVAAGPNGIDVATGAGLLRILRLQVPGGKPLAAAEFLNGRPGFGTSGG